MRVRMTVGLSGPAYQLAPGDEREFPDAEARRLIAAGFAIPVVELETEFAVVEPMMERRGRKRRA
jgi:hypothetical protein